MLKESFPGRLLTSKQRKSVILANSQRWTCVTNWKHFLTLQRFLQGKFPHRLSRQSRHDLKILSPSQPIAEQSNDWRQTHPWDVNLPGIMVLLSSLPVFTSPKVCPVPLPTHFSFFPADNQAYNPHLLLLHMPSFWSLALFRSSLSPYTHPLYPLCPPLCSLLSIFLWPIFLDDFGEHRSLWPSDNNVLDR